MILRRTLLSMVLGAAVGGAAVFQPLSTVSAETADVKRIDISVRPIDSFEIGSDATRFGALEFVGGLEMTASSRDFGGLSSFRFLAPGTDFIGVSDAGSWVFGTIMRDTGGKPSGVDDFRMQRMFDRAGSLSGGKRAGDAEGLAVKDGVATVSFEREHRVAQFRIEPDGMKPAFKELDFLIPKRELRQNKGFETVVHTHPGGQNAGGLVVISEGSLDKHGNVFAAVIEGPNRGIFTVKREGEFGITDGAFLPDGDLLLLERSYSFAAGVKMRLRRIDGEQIAKGALADGPVLMQADMQNQIDNMEGLDVWVRDDGALMVSLVSDDNFSLFQRNLYLEFVLHDDVQPQATSN
jgi:hypothetical protein